MNKKLLLNALIKYFSGLLAVSALIFFPAGTVNYPNGWLFIGLLFIPMLLLGIILYFKAPKLLQKRLNAKEQQKTQKTVIVLSAFVFLCGFIVSGLDFRFGWSKLPPILVCIASILLLISYATYAEVMRENAYLSRAVEVQKNQKVIYTGLYSIVRHPMYSSVIMLFLSIPLVLGSIYGFIVFLVFPFLIVLRIKNEEMILEQKLNGYAAYMKKVKYRLLPFIW